MLNSDLFYGRSSTDGERYDFSLGSKDVLSTFDVVQDPFSHKVFFDHLFIGFELLAHLHNLVSQATGKLRKNRLRSFF